MGGNLFKLGRKPRAEYLEIEAEVCRFLDGLVGPEAHRVPRYYGSKADFGDLDVVISRAAIDELGGWERFREAVAEGLGVTRSKSVGHVYSTAYREFQVDYFVRSPELLEATYNYLSFNDLGNLIGKIYRRLGLKYGEDGLSYVFRRDSQPSYKRELLVSRDWPRILAFIGLELEPWRQGFATLEDMFEWVVASPWFSVEPYERLDKRTKKRAQVRPTMARFLDWLDEHGVDERRAYARERDAYVPMIAAAFPEAELEQALADERRREAEVIELRAKFRGDLVREWTGLEGKALGAFLRGFKAEHPEAKLRAMTPEAIRAAVEDFAKDA